MPLFWLVLTNGLAPTEKHLADATKPWCWSEVGVPNDVVRPPFKIGAQTAVVEVTRSKHMEVIRRRDPSGAPAVGEVDCPSTCVRTEPR